ncbi:SDR family NAD(P)-dependent oxidoreductase [Luteibaculum oceani]|uniref:SDR family oxidoreductase n=1 Tax=Luteibaculum oceani TaxID=1294296 RepID=A0A5C6URF0_9FLAO|nr:SDR family oxidoreductase [Luteibaculum oceani]TXC75579.1 SDR family oxidoreductase [Luteibaculum oceani]
MDKCFVITGAGTGIGQAAALELGNANNNHILVLVGRREGPLYDTLALLNNPQRAIVATADVRELNQLKEVAEKADLANKSLSGIFVNAGIGGENHAGPTDRWFDIINTNLTGAYNTVHAFLPYLKTSQADKKNILFTSSILAKIGVPGYEAYCASKAGVLGLTRSLATTLAPDKIAVNALCPGWVDTKMARTGLEQFAEKVNQPVEKIIEREMARVPFGKMSTPTEIGKWVKFIFTGSQFSLTGQSIDVNNGAFMD